MCGHIQEEYYANDLPGYKKLQIFQQGKTGKLRRTCLTSVLCLLWLGRLIAICLSGFHRKLLSVGRVWIDISQKLSRNGQKCILVLHDIDEALHIFSVAIKTIAVRAQVLWMGFSVCILCLRRSTKCRHFADDTRAYTSIKPESDKYQQKIGE